MNRQLYNVTRPMSDAEFEREITELRQIRAAERQERDYVRAMDRATMGISSRRGAEADALQTAEGRQLALMRDYARLGLGTTEINRLLRGQF